MRAQGKLTVRASIPFGHAVVAFAGTGEITAKTIAKSVAAARLSGAGAMVSKTHQRMAIAPHLAGDGSMNAGIAVSGGSVHFAAAGSMYGPRTGASVRFSGTGRMTAAGS